ncbi:hypothetical protein CFBP6600_32500 [Xanthomonas arboricola pv. corylina]|nr:hypothetical protein CFBP6600_32500 [Xanthomonas arboricola pv. corylina]CAE6817477.1 hypothetical protein CFBP6600_32500 [Xanthomonas arboricola pv. corylina]
MCGFLTENLLDLEDALLRQDHAPIVVSIGDGKR